MTAVPVESEHQLRPSALPQRLRCDEGLEARDQLLVASESELGVREILERAQAELLQACGLVRRELRIDNVDERGSAPELHPLGQQPRGQLRVFGEERSTTFGGQPFEAPAVDRLFGRVQLIARRRGCENSAAIGAGLEQVAERGDMNLEGVLCPRRRALAPQRVDQVFSRNRTVRLERERQQHFALIAARDRHDVRSAPYLERAENPVIEPHFDCPALQPALSGA